MSLLLVYRLASVSTLLFMFVWGIVDNLKRLFWYRSPPNIALDINYWQHNIQNSTTLYHLVLSRWSSDQNILYSDHTGSSDRLLNLYLCSKPRQMWQLSFKFNSVLSLRCFLLYIKGKEWILMWKWLTSSKIFKEYVLSSSIK